MPNLKLPIQTLLFLLTFIFASNLFAEGLTKCCSYSVTNTTPYAGRFEVVSQVVSQQSSTETYEIPANNIKTFQIHRCNSWLFGGCIGWTDNIAERVTFSYKEFGDTVYKKVVLEKSQYGNTDFRISRVDRTRVTISAN